MDLSGIIGIGLKWSSKIQLVTIRLKKTKKKQRTNIVGQSERDANEGLLFRLFLAKRYILPNTRFGLLVNRLFSDLNNNWAIWVEAIVPLLSIFEMPKKNWPFEFLWKFGLYFFLIFGHIFVTSSRTFRNKGGRCTAFFMIYEMW